MMLNVNEGGFTFKFDMEPDSFVCEDYLHVAYKMFGDNLLHAYDILHRKRSIDILFIFVCSS